MPHVVRELQFLERASATGFSFPEMCRMTQSNSVMAERCRCWRLETGSDFFLMASTRGIWSVKTSNGTASRKCLKWRMAAWTARSSLSNVEYLDSAGESFLLKKAMGAGPLFVICWRAAPMALSLASVTNCRQASLVGKERRTALEMAALTSLKDYSNYGFHIS